MQDYHDVSGLTDVINHISNDENAEQECQLQEEFRLSKGWIIERLATLNDAYHV